MDTQKTAVLQQKMDHQNYTIEYFPGKTFIGTKPTVEIPDIDCMDDEEYNAFVLAYTKFCLESYRSSIINVPRRTKDMENPRKKIRRIM